MRGMEYNVEYDTEYWRVGRVVYTYLLYDVDGGSRCILYKYVLGMYFVPRGGGVDCSRLQYTNYTISCNICIYIYIVDGLLSTVLLTTFLPSSSSSAPVAYGVKTTTDTL